ncbi:MAG: matrixin family metalloprotease [Desulfobacteraceae bacterium]|jgi:hypothetical protein
MKRWLLYLIIGIVVISTGIGVFYGVYTHKEPGFMRICWQNGVANYNGECQEIIWPKNKIPITYYINSDKQNKDYDTAIKAGANLWNKEVCPLFREVNDINEATVIVSWGYIDTTTMHSAAHTSHEGQNGPERANVVFNTPSDTHAIYLFAAHEFGHVLGLDHDTAPNNIMYPTQPGLTKNIQFVLPSDHDIKLLQKHYCQ